MAETIQRSLLTLKNTDGSILVSVSDQVLPQAADLVDLLNVIEKNPNNQDGAIYVKVPDTVFHRFLPQLLKLKYQFQRYDETPNSPRSFVYYKWNALMRADEVQPQATSLDHFAALIYSPNEQAVLMVKENDKWKFITGPVTKTSGTVTGLIAFLAQNFSIELDPGFRPVYAGGWIREKGRYGYIHDRMDCFALRATRLEVNNTLKNIQEMTWMSVSDLKNVVAEYRSYTEDLLAKTGIQDTDVVLFRDQAFNKYHMAWLSHTLQGKVLPIVHSMVGPSNNSLFMIGGV